MYVNNRKPRNKTYIPINAVRVVGVEEYTSTNAYFNTYISDTKKCLRAGNEVLVFHQYQLDALTEIYKDNLESRFDKRYDWWVCRLKDVEYVAVKERKPRGPDTKPRKKRSPETKPRKPRNPETFYQRSDVTYDRIMELIKKGYTYAKIAKELNCSLNTIKRRLYREEI